MGTITDKMIDTAVSGLDCEGIHKAMASVGWYWAFPDEESGVPSPREVRQCARHLCNELRDRNVDIYCTGGLEVAFKDDVLSIRFVFAESSTQGDL